MSGTLQDLNARQADALKELKKNLGNDLKPEHDDHLLLRFLRARKFDVKKTEIMFRKDIEWRAQQRIDTINDWFEIPEVCLKYWPGGSIGLDKEGHIVWISPLGNVDPKGILYSVKAGDVVKTNITIAERLMKEEKEISKKLGRHIEGVTYVIDLEHLGTAHMWKQGITCFSEIITVLEEHYPEFIHRIFVVRPTKEFPAIYFVLKPFFSKDTMAKIRILESNWRDVLLKHIDAEILPVHCGGTLTDSDGNPNMCPSKINLGGKVPRFFYKKGSDLSHGDMTTQDIPGKRSIEIKVKVKTLASVLRYEFKTRSHDIAFGITRVLDNGKKQVILTEKRYNCHVVPEDGEVFFEEPGLYIVKFDNHGSFQKTRRLSYWMEVVEPRIPFDVEDMRVTLDDITRDSGFFPDDQVNIDHNRRRSRSMAQVPWEMNPASRQERAKSFYYRQASAYL